MKRMLWTGLLAAMWLAGQVAVAAAATNAPPAETAAAREARMRWFSEARFGMFIHWGLYAVPAGEWKGGKDHGEWIMETGKIPVSEYETFAARFNPVKFNAAEWVALARVAGMKYMVITSKHHDGFALYPSALTDWCIKSTPFQRDPLKELADACRKQDLVFCFYHSIMDWRHPDYAQRRAWNDKATGTPDMDRYVGFLKGQLKELLTNYGPIGILWFDGEWEQPWTHERGVDLYHYVRGLQPRIIVNNRVGKGRAGMMGMDQGAERVGDYGTPEQEIPPAGFGPGVDWESCMTMNNHWGYNQYDQNWKSAETLIRNLVDCASKGGNYLLNVGPTAEGLIPAASVERLQAVGRWMAVNSEAIYGTVAGPFKRQLPWGRCTQKEGKLYLHVFDWPADGKLTIPLLNPVKKARLLAEPRAKLTVASSEEGLTLGVPAAMPDPAATVIELEIKGAPQVAQAGLRAGADGVFSLTATAADITGHGLKVETTHGAPNLGYWLNPADFAEWSITVTRTGRYRVEMDVAVEPKSSGGQFVLTCGEQKLTGVLESTGGWGTYAKRVAGELNLAAGGCTVKLACAEKKGEALLNLRGLTLTPAAP